MMEPMKRDQIARMYGYLNECHRVTRRIIDAFPDDRLDWAPAEGARTPRQIVEHIYGSSVAHAHAAHTGTLTQEDHHAAEDAPRAGGTAELIAWADAKWAAMQADATSVDDEGLAGTVKAFYGEFPVWMMLSFNYDEHWHHRGQLTVYLRLLGVEVPFLYDYAPRENEP
jgi:uncharacterized damage-inducible protein DinB